MDRFRHVGNLQLSKSIERYNSAFVETSYGIMKNFDRITIRDSAKLSPNKLTNSRHENREISNVIVGYNEWKLGIHVRERCIISHTNDSLRFERHPRDSASDSIVTLLPRHPVSAREL